MNALFLGYNFGKPSCWGLSRTAVCLLTTRGKQGQQLLRVDGRESTDSNSDRYCHGPGPGTGKATTTVDTGVPTG